MFCLKEQSIETWNSHKFARMKYGVFVFIAVCHFQIYIFSLSFSLSLLASQGIVCTCINYSGYPIIWRCSTKPTKCLTNCLHTTRKIQDIYIYIYLFCITSFGLKSIINWNLFERVWMTFSIHRLDPVFNLTPCIPNDRRLVFHCVSTATTLLLAIATANWLHQIKIHCFGLLFNFAW